MVLAACFCFNYPLKNFSVSCSYAYATGFFNLFYQCIHIFRFYKKSLGSIDFQTIISIIICKIFQSYFRSFFCVSVECYSQHFFLICCIFCFFNFRIKHYTLKRLIQFSKFLLLYSFLSKFIIAAIQLHGIGFLSNAHIHTVKCINIYQCRNLQNQIKRFQLQKTVHRLF